MNKRILGRSRSAPRLAVVLASVGALCLCSCLFDRAGVHYTGPADGQVGQNDAALTDGAAADAAQQPDGAVTSDAGPNPDGAVASDADPGPDGMVIADSSVPDAGPLDSDGDTIPDSIDNCDFFPSLNQNDQDGDGEGDVCDDDIDGDGIPNLRDPEPTTFNTVLYFDELTTQPNDFEDGPGTWGYSGDAYCQSDNAEVHTFSRLNTSELSTTDYAADTIVTVNSTTGVAPEWPAAGLAFRTQNPNNYWSYVCAVDLLNGRLVLMSYENPTIYFLDNTANGSVPLTGTYHLRVSAVGNNLNCELVGGPSISIADSYNPIGTVGFYTYKADACFEYLLVYTP